MDLLWHEIYARTQDLPAHKRLAVQKYMRKTIQDMRLPELQIFSVRRSDLSVLLDQASRGYDRFMAKRAKRDDKG